MAPVKGGQSNGASSSAGEGDVVLIFYQDQPTVFARIESIQPDVKKDWFQVTLLLLTIPTQAVTWILREAYVNGTPFTMGGRPMRIEPVKKTPLRKADEARQTEEKKGPSKEGKVIPFKKP